MAAAAATNRADQCVSGWIEQARKKWHLVCFTVLRAYVQGMTGGPERRQTGDRLPVGLRKRPLEI